MANVKITCGICGEVSEEPITTPYVLGDWEGQPFASVPRSVVVECPMCASVWAVDGSEVRIEPQ